ncbi:hypothetical protein CDL12_24394 [Handroanthus impetiginosus]|uniref:F-box domain-containing protein n=1 Tax=Handroanthus impetiginosus TaxID=429701 RepID=A0A2G9GCZ5_9LAMI|nr:hypothetical protein CDL12_24394 [Handroanthus impetiginosus]
MGRKKSKSKLKKPKHKKKTPTVRPDRSVPGPPWIDLPRDVTANILQRLDAFDILENVQRVCTTWRRVCQDPAMWRVIVLRDPGDLHRCYDLNRMCCHAVDRSQGNLIELHIEYFGDDEMLHYIAERSSRLRRLTLACCYDISGEGLSEAVKKFPQLEELHLTIMPGVQAAEIEMIGISCPMLKSFTFNESGHKYPYNDLSDDEFMEGPELNEHAVAVAKSMPNLCHLRLFANLMKNEGLQAILDGCPKLESLDLRQCYGVDLGGDLGKRCTQQIKDLRRPLDSVDDYEWDAGQSPEGPYSPIYSDSFSFEGYDYAGGYDSYESYDYDDYTNPFCSEYLCDDDLWFLNRLNFP